MSVPSPIAAPPTSWTLRLPRGRRLALGGGRPKVMGIVNVTPDSFSDGGLYLAPDRAVDRALGMLAEGADVIDLGAESTRPGGGVYGRGAEAVPAEEEIRRLLPVLERLRPATDAPLSVDTRKGEVARAVLAAGADLINDISHLSDPDLGRAAAEAGCPVVLMHSRGEISTMQRKIRFEDLLAEIAGELTAALERAQTLGLHRDQVILDPGIGFGKTAEQNLEILARLDAFTALGRPLLVGASRKSFVGFVSGAPPAERLPGSLAAAAWAAHHHAALVRVHEVAETVQFLEVWQAIRAAGEERG